MPMADKVIIRSIDDLAKPNQVLFFFFFYIKIHEGSIVVTYLFEIITIWIQLFVMYSKKLCN